jgi:hypothetical protein
MISPEHSSVFNETRSEALTQEQAEAEIALKVFLKNVLSDKKIKEDLDDIFYTIKNNPSLVSFHSLSSSGEAIGSIGCEIILGDLIINGNLILSLPDEDKQEGDNVYDISERITGNFTAQPDRYLSAASLEINFLYGTDKLQPDLEDLRDETGSITLSVSPGGGLAIETCIGQDLPFSTIATIVELVANDVINQDQARPR